MLLTILVTLIIAGVVVYLIRTAPFVAEPFKSIAVWVVVLFAVIYLLKLLPNSGFLN